MDRRRARVPAGEPRRRPHSIRSRPTGPDPARARLGVARLSTTRRRGTLYAAVNYPGRRRARRRHRDRTRARSSGSRTSRGRRLHRDVARPRPRQPARSSTPPTTALARPGARSIPRPARTTLLQKDARIGDLVFDPPTESLWGIRHLDGLCTLVRIPPPYRDWKQVHTFAVRHGGVRPRRLAGRPQLVASFGEISGKQDVRVLSVEALGRGDATPVARFDFGTVGAEQLRLLTERPLPVRQLLLHRRLEHLPLRHRDRKARRGHQHRHRASSGPFRSADDELIAFRYTGEGFVPARIAARRSRTSAPITFLGERLAAEHPVIKHLERRLAVAIPFDAVPTADRRRTAWPAGCGASRSTPSCRATRTAPARRHAR